MGRAVTFLHTYTHSLSQNCYLYSLHIYIYMCMHTCVGSSHLSLILPKPVDQPYIVHSCALLWRKGIKNDIYYTTGPSVAIEQPPITEISITEEDIMSYSEETMNTLPVEGEGLDIIQPRTPTHPACSVAVLLEELGCSVAVLLETFCGGMSKSQTQISSSGSPSTSTQLRKECIADISSAWAST